MMDMTVRANTLARKISRPLMDFFFWDYCKELIYKTLPEDAEDLETKLRYVVWVFEEDVMENVQRNLLRCKPAL